MSEGLGITFKETSKMISRVGGELAVEKEVGNRDPYDSSIATEKLRTNLKRGQPLKIACLDLDATMSGNPERQQYARQLLEKQGYVVIFVTSRTEEMVMSKKEYEKSQELGLMRPAPKMGTENGVRIPLFADSYYRYAGLYNPDIIGGSTGSGELLIHQQKGGYVTDSRFSEEQRQYTQGWRKTALALLEEVDPSNRVSNLSPLEYKENYESGINDVCPPDARIAVEFTPHNSTIGREDTGSTAGNKNTTKEVVAEGLERKAEYLGLLRERLNVKKQEIREKLKQTDIPISEKEQFEKQLSLLDDLRITDDSNPEHGKFAVLISPTRGYKARALETAVTRLVQSIGIKKDQIELLIAGDSWPDLAMGLYAGTGTKATFLLAGGSRMSDALSDDSKDNFSDNPLSAIKKRLVQINPGTNDGRYIFRMPLFGERELIIADRAYPKLAEVESLIAYLEK